MNIWTEENKYRAWFEILADECRAELGETLQDVAWFVKADFDIDRLGDWAGDSLTMWWLSHVRSETLGEERGVHYGLITDVVDTAYGYLYKQVNDIIRRPWKTPPTSSLIYKEHKFTHQMGRTKSAEPTTFLVLNWRLVIVEMKRSDRAFRHAAVGVEAGKISGAAANIPPFVEQSACLVSVLKKFHIMSFRTLSTFAVLASIATYRAYGDWDSWFAKIRTTWSGRILC